MKNEVYYKIDFAQVADPSQTPYLFFSNALGCDLSMWDIQIEKLISSFNIISYDTRGHGNSLIYQRPFTISDLAKDVINILDQNQIAKANFVGISLGGLIGLDLALNHPNRFSKMVIANSGAKLGTTETWQERINIVNSKGVSALVSTIIPKWFSEEFRNKNSEKVNKFINMLKNCDRDGYLANCHAISKADYREDINKIQIPILIIAGKNDSSTPIGLSQFIHQEIPESRLIELDSAHISSVEYAQEFSNNLLDFFLTTK